MEVSAPERTPNRALAAASLIKQSTRMLTNKRKQSGNKITETRSNTSTRVVASSSPSELLEYAQQDESKRGTFLYLAYGSNLSNETFRGNRGIKPLSQVNVQVPELRLTFDLPGIPYAEPCFANTGRRDPDNDQPSEADVGNEKTPLLAQATRKDKYRKDRWHKGLIGVVYEVTPSDYAHIIETEGGGSSYQDILVDCHPFTPNDPSAPVPQNPVLPPFKAHTLFAPAEDPSEGPGNDGGRFKRPDPSYAQASARYLKLMTDGARELDLPYEYQDYLHALRPYTMTTNKQRIGQFVFLSLWGPFVALVFAMGKMFADDKGRLPGWLVELTSAIFKAVWASYDSFFKPMFGNGERTITEGGDESDGDRNNGKHESRRSSWLSRGHDRVLEKHATAEHIV